LLKKCLWFVFIIAGLCIFLRGCFLRPATNFAGTHFNQGTNAVWLGVEWTKQPHNSVEISTLANTLKEEQIRYVFAYTSYLKPNGQFNPSYTYANQFIQEFKTAYPHSNVQAWIGLPLEYVDLNNQAVREQIIVFCVYLVQEKGFDGVHLDPEPVSNNNNDLLVLLNELRTALGSEATISIATRRIWPIFPNVEWPLVGKISWHTNYYREVANRVDQIVVMIYDSAMPSAVLYRQWSRFQVIEISQAVHSTHVELFFGVPTSEEKTYTHWPIAENMSSGLQGIIDGLNDAKAYPSGVNGVAIYPYWETDEIEWSIYHVIWLGR
jgi:hypothetical protein